MVPDCQEEIFDDKLLMASRSCSARTPERKGAKLNRDDRHTVTTRREPQQSVRPLEAADTMRGSFSAT